MPGSNRDSVRSQIPVGVTAETHGCCRQPCGTGTFDIASRPERKAAPCTSLLLAAADQTIM